MSPFIYTLIDTSSHLSICLSTHLSIELYIHCPSIICVYVHTRMCTHTYIYINIRMYVCIHIYIHSYFHLSIQLFIHPSTLSFLNSVHFYIHYLPNHHLSIHPSCKDPNGPVGVPSSGHCCRWNVAFWRAMRVRL